MELMLIKKIKKSCGDHLVLQSHFGNNEIIGDKELAQDDKTIKKHLDHPRDILIETLSSSQTTLWYQAKNKMKNSENLFQQL